MYVCMLVVLICMYIIGIYVYITHAYYCYICIRGANGLDRADTVCGGLLGYENSEWAGLIHYGLGLSSFPIFDL